MDERARVDKLVEVVRENQDSETEIVRRMRKYCEDYNREKLMEDMLLLAKHWEQTHAEINEDEIAMNQLNQLIDEAIEMWGKTNKVQFLSEIRKLLNDRRAWRRGESGEAKQVVQQIQITFMPCANVQFASEEGSMESNRK